MTMWGVQYRMAAGRPWINGAWPHDTRKAARKAAVAGRDAYGFGNTRVVKAERVEGSSGPVLSVPAMLGTLRCAYDLMVKANPDDGKRHAEISIAPVIRSLEAKMAARVIRSNTPQE